MAERKSIDIAGVRHGAPIPFGSKIGNMLFSSGIHGQDPSTGELSPDPSRQAECVFRNVAELLKAAGGTPDHIGRMTVFIKDNSLREYVNREWLNMFPDEHSRPARHTMVHNLPGGMLVQVEIIAVL